MSIETMKQALEALEAPHPHIRTRHSDAMKYREKVKQAITALRQAIEEAQPPHSHQYVEVRIKVGDFHIKKAVTEMEFLKAYDPIKLLSLVADDCVQHLKEVL
jgi:hypothetical protein